MLRLSTLAVLFLSCVADPRSPRIYNVLITSNKNLSPSHAQPVYEPVLRTTSIGYAFPSWLYHTSFLQGVPTTYINPGYSGVRRIETPSGNPERQTQPSDDPLLEPLNKGQQPSDNSGHFIDQYNPYALNFGKYLPKEEDSDGLKTFVPPGPEETDPKKVIANLRKNSEIPDVPPPPLPVRVLKKDSKQ